MYSYDIAPAVDPQVLRGMRQSILSTSSSAAAPATPLSLTSGAMAAALHETSMESLRRKYIGFDYTPSHSFGGNSAKQSANASSAAGVKRARSPTTTVSAVLEEDTRPGHGTAAAITSSTATAAAPRADPGAPFTPSAVVAAPDYQGRSYLFPPTVLTAAASLASPAPQARIPKRMVAMGKEHAHGVQILRWAMPHAHLVFSGDIGGTVKVWNPSSMATMRSAVATFSGHSLSITAMCVEEEGRLLSTSSHDGTIRQWDAEVGVLKHTIQHKGGVGCSEHVLHPESNALVLGAFDKEVALFDVRASLTKPQRLYQGHMGGIMSLAFTNTATGNMFASSSSDKTIRTWDFRVPVQVRQLGDPSMHAVAHLLKHPTKEVLLAQSADNKIRVIDCDESGRLRVVRDRQYVGHTVSGTSCQLSISRDGQYVSSGDATGQLYVWSYDTMELAKKFPAHSRQCSAHLWHPYEASRMVTGGWDSMVKVWA